MPRDLDSPCGYFNMFCLYLLIPKLLIGGLPQLMHTLHDVEASNGGHVQWYQHSLCNCGHIHNGEILLRQLSWLYMVVTPHSLMDHVLWSWLHTAGDEPVRKVVRPNLTNLTAWQGQIVQCYVQLMQC